MLREGREHPAGNQVALSGRDPLRSPCSVKSVGCWTGLEPLLATAIQAAGIVSHQHFVRQSKEFPWCHVPLKPFLVVFISASLTTLLIFLCKVQSSWVNNLQGLMCPIDLSFFLLFSVCPQTALYFPLKYSLFICKIIISENASSIAQLLQVIRFAV